MKRVKVRTFSGVVCEQEVFSIGDRTDVRRAEYKPRFETEEERQKHKDEISRRNLIRLINENCSPESLYSTLTFNKENEVHDATDCRIIRDRYFRRLKYAYPDAVIFAFYGQGKTTHRFHLHIISNGIPEDFIKEKWTFGEISRIEHLREHCYYDGVDHGQDYKGLANYLFDHWEPRFGGHRWKMTKNVRRPEREKPKEVKRTYSEKRPPIAPKGYTLVETKANQYGYLYFRYIKMPEESRTPRRRQRAAPDGIG